MPEPHGCPHCGDEIPSDATEDLCPKCLIALALEGQETSPLDPAPLSTVPSRFTAPEPEELAGRFPQLEVLELLGQGGMGAVYKARQPALDRLVALKILPPEVAEDPTFSDRFGREARALAKLNHPNIVGIHDFGQVDGLYYFVMEFVDGLNLRQMLTSGQLTPREALTIVPQICEALQYAHDEGLVHRDIKPENLLLDRKGRVKIADFGLAKVLRRTEADLMLTGSHHVMGTPHYMAPEQTEHPLEVDHRADIYSLGVVFYEMLTGELPLGRFGPPSQKAQLDVRLDEVVMRALEKEPERRYQKANEMKTSLDSVQSRSDAGAKTSYCEPAAAPPAMNSLGSAVFKSPAGLKYSFMVSGILFVAWIGVVLLLKEVAENSVGPEVILGIIGIPYVQLGIALYYLFRRPKTSDEQEFQRRWKIMWGALQVAAFASYCPVVIIVFAAHWILQLHVFVTLALLVAGSLLEIAVLGPARKRRPPGRTSLYAVFSVYLCGAGLFAGLFAAALADMERDGVPLALGIAVALLGASVVLAMIGLASIRRSSGALVGKWLSIAALVICVITFCGGAMYREQIFRLSSLAGWNVYDLGTESASGKGYETREACVAHSRGKTGVLFGFTDLGDEKKLTYVVLFKPGSPNAPHTAIRGAQTGDTTESRFAGTLTVNAVEIPLLHVLRFDHPPGAKPVVVKDETFQMGGETFDLTRGRVLLVDFDAGSPAFSQLSDQLNISVPGLEDHRDVRNFADVIKSAIEKNYAAGFLSN